MSRVFTNNVANYLSPNSPYTVYDFGTGTLTFAAWIKRGAITTVDGRFLVLSGAGGNQYLWAASSVSDFLVYHNGTSSVAANAAALTSTANWVHIATTRTLSDVQFYVNGASAGSGTLAGSTGNADALTIGWGGSFLGESYVGKMAYLTMWNTVLSPANIALLATTSLATPESVGTGCIAAWHMDTDDGGSVLDSSVSAKPAAVAGTVAFDADNPTYTPPAGSGFRSIAGGGSGAGYGGADDDDWYRR